MQHLVPEHRRQVNIGDKFACLLVVENPFYQRTCYKEGSKKGRHQFVKCQCDCGNSTIVRCRDLIIGKVKRCTYSCPLRRLTKEDFDPNEKVNNPLPIGFICNNLTTIEETKYQWMDNPERKRHKKQRVVKCKCKCGIEKYFHESVIKGFRIFGCGFNCPYTKDLLSDKNRIGSLAENGLKECCSCHEIKSLENFNKLSSRKDGLHPRCKACKKAASVWNIYKVTIVEIELMLKQQKGKCSICSASIYLSSKTKDNQYKLNIDHCHKTGKVRSLLCNRCNTGLGSFQENIDVLKSAIKYLRKFNERNKETS